MKNIFFIFIIFLINETVAQKVTISGYVRDSQTGEGLIGAIVSVKEANNGVAVNDYGFYSLTVQQGNIHLKVSYMGYETVERELNLVKNEKLNIEMKIQAKTLDFVQVTGEKIDKNVQDVQMSVTQLDMKTVNKIPVLLGESDVLKVIQLLPGVQGTGEGTTGFSVRGGNVDQNLILLDHAPVYNASHAGGIFSVFNGDAIRDLQLYKGGIPAEYGGKLSSVLDIHMKEGNRKRISASGGIGLLSSRLTLEGPIKKDKGSFIISGRRTYFDVFFPFLKDTVARNAKVHYGDYNLKLNYEINDKNRLFLSGYFGRDVLQPTKDFQFSYGNKTGTFRWNHLFNDKIFSDFMLIYSNYDYNLGVPTGPSAFIWKSNIINYSFKNDYTWFLSPSHTVKFGWQSIYYTFVPGKFKALENSFLNLPNLPNKDALENAFYLSDEWEINPRITAEIGFRFNIFQNIGTMKFSGISNEKGTMVYHYDENYKTKDSMFYKNGEIYKTYTSPEPRLAMRFVLDGNSSLKMSYNRMSQYVHLASNSTAATPIDIWVSSSPNLKPQFADQVATGYFRNFLNNNIEASIELYYKKMYNAIDFKDHAFLLLNKHVEAEMRIGSAESYGIEFYLAKKVGRLTGWISYTYSKTTRTIAAIYNGKPYAAPYDRPHNLAIVTSYDVNKRWNLSCNWVYMSDVGRTMPTARMEYDNMIVPVYSDRNTVRLDSYHRFDFSATWYMKKASEKNPKKNGKKRLNYEQNLNFSIYNVYNRHNAFSYRFSDIPNEPYKTKAERIYLFKMLPSVTWNFSF